jgi:hypothetical protein
MTDMPREEQHETAGLANEPPPPPQQQQQLALNCVPDEVMRFAPQPVPQGAGFVPFQLSDEMCTLLP